MRKLIVIMIICLSGCALDTQSDFNNATLEGRINKSEIYYNDDFYYLDSIADICHYIMYNVNYKADRGDIWSDPKTTLTRGYGDCEDMTILFMNIYYIVFGEKCELVTVNSSRKVEAGGIVNHALVRLPNGRLQEANVVGTNQSLVVGYSFGFDSFFY